MGLPVGSCHGLTPQAGFVCLPGTQHSVPKACFGSPVPSPLSWKWGAAAGGDPAVTQGPGVTWQAQWEGLAQRLGTAFLEHGLSFTTCCENRKNRCFFRTVLALTLLPFRSLAFEFHGGTLTFRARPAFTWHTTHIPPGLLCLLILHHWQGNGGTCYALSVIQ